VRLVSPTDTQALARSIIELFENENERQRLSSGGLKRAAQFSWEETARLTLEVYTELLRRVE
jgi:glycosyltransferase involved in cell wall biosynthesis